MAASAARRDQKLPSPVLPGSGAKGLSQPRRVARNEPSAALEAPLFRRRPLDHKSGKRRKLSPLRQIRVALRRSGTMPAGRPRERPVAASPPALKRRLRRAGDHPSARRQSAPRPGMPYRGARPASPGPRAGYSSGST